MFRTAILLSCGMASSAWAETMASTRTKNLTLLGISSATVAPAGVGFASLSYTDERTPDNSDEDGSAAFGFGLGNARTGIGFQFTTHITSLKDDFADAGYLSVKAARQIRGGDMPLFLGAQAEHLAGWGDSSDTDPRGLVALTAFRSGATASGEVYPQMFTIGVGSDLRNDNTDPGIFLGAGIGLTEIFGTSLAWTGETATLGISVRPPDIRVGDFVDDSIVFTNITMQFLQLKRPNFIT